MKTLKVDSSDKKEFSLDRKSLAKIGDSLYFNPEVSGIKIQIKFKDRTKLEYLRHHVIDDIENTLEKQEENTEAEEDEDF